MNEKTSFIQGTFPCNHYSQAGQEPGKKRSRCGLVTDSSRRRPSEGQTGRRRARASQDRDTALAPQGDSVADLGRGRRTPLRWPFPLR
jgi:hypothetical protein